MKPNTYNFRPHRRALKKRLADVRSKMRENPFYYADSKRLIREMNLARKMCEASRDHFDLVWVTRRAEELHRESRREGFERRYRPVRVVTDKDRGRYYHKVWSDLAVSVAQMAANLRTLGRAMK